MHKRILAAGCAALLLVGLPASATQSAFETPALVTGSVLGNYVGSLHCSAFNAGVVAVDAYLAMWNAETSTLVASSNVVVPANGMAKIAFQPTHGNLQKYFCAVMPPSRPIPQTLSCDSELKVPSHLAPLRAEIAIMNFTNNVPKSDAFPVLINRGNIPTCGS